MEPRPPARKPRLGHAHLKVRALDRSIHFYEEVLGWAVTERFGDTYAFLSGGTRHHELALQAIGPDAISPDVSAVGLYHLAFEFPSIADWRLAIDRAVKLGCRTTPIDHGISWAAYLNDPDGNGVELYIDRRNQPSGTAHWSGRSFALNLHIERPPS